MVPIGVLLNFGSIRMETKVVDVLFKVFAIWLTVLLISLLF